MRFRKDFTSGLLALAFTACAPLGADFSNPPPSEASAILGGVEITPGHPALRHVVAVIDTESRGTCTGTLLGRNLVLTAAHCLNRDASKMIVAFGTPLVPNSPNLPVVAAAASPLWEGHQNHAFDNGDIALLIFKGELPASYQGVPFLPEATAQAMAKGSPVWLLGYGMDNAAEKTGIGRLRMTTSRVENPRFSSTEFSVDQSQGQGACHGDSGGPVFVILGGQPYILGVINRAVGDPDDLCRVSSVATKALSYQTWIEEASAELIRKSRGRNDPFAGL